MQSCEHALTTLFSTFGSNWAFSTYLNSLPWRCEFRCQVTGHFATPASVAYGRPAAATSAPSAQQKDRRPDGRARRAGPSAGARTAPPASCRPTETSTAPWPITPGMQKPLIISPLRPRPPSGSKKNRKSRGPPNERFEPIRPATEQFFCPTLNDRRFSEMWSRRVDRRGPIIFGCLVVESASAEYRDKSSGGALKKRPRRARKCRSARRGSSRDATVAPAPPHDTPRPRPCERAPQRSRSLGGARGLPSISGTILRLCAKTAPLLL